VSSPLPQRRPLRYFSPGGGTDDHRLPYVVAYRRLRHQRHNRGREGMAKRYSPAQIDAFAKLRILRGTTDTSGGAASHPATIRRALRSH
jgi:hypothetical protein